MAYQPKTYRKSGGDVLMVASGGSIQTEKDVGTAASSCVATECVDGVHKTTITLTAKSMDITDGAPGYGNVKLYDFPAGAILTLGATVDLSLTAGTGGIVDAFDGDFALGSTGTSDGTIDGTDVDILPSTATIQGVAGVGNAHGQSAAAQITVKDGTTTAVDLYLNVIIDDADISAADTLALTGTVTIVWVNLGDY